MISEDPTQYLKRKGIIVKRKGPRYEMGTLRPHSTPVEPLQEFIEPDSPATRGLTE